MSLAVTGLLVFVVSCAAGLLVTPKVRAVGLRLRLVATPTADRWHQRPTALLGGVAIVLATLVGVGIWTAVSALQGRPGGAPVVSLQSAAVVMGAVFMFTVGLIDDILNLRPQLKFILQTLVGVGLVGAGASLALTPWYVVNVVATVFWFVALGLHERQVALLLYAFAALGGCVGLVLMRLDLALGLVLGTAFFASLSLIAAYLGRLKVGHADVPAGSKAATVVVTELLYKKRLAEMLLDVLLVAGAYYGAYRLKFEGGAPPAYMAAFESTVGLVIAVKISAFGLLGVYRGAWRYTGLEELDRILVAIIPSSAGLGGSRRVAAPA